MKKPYDWSTFTRKIAINVPAQDVYNAWTTPANLESQFLSKTEFIKADGTPRAIDSHLEKGDTYKWWWFGYDGAGTGDVLETNGKDFFKFVFGTAGNVSVTIKTENNLTICELTQSEIPTDDASRAEYHVGCTEGWTFYLANLKSILQGGIDLRNKDAKVKGVVNS